MMHYQAVASPAGVINDVTHHTILPPLLSITSALVKCTTYFWHNATMYLCTSTYGQHFTAHDPSTAHGILSSGRAACASMQPLASFPCYQRPLTHTTDVLAESSCTTEKSGRHMEK